jgi:hypothetical protein
MMLFLYGAVTDGRLRHSPLSTRTADVEAETAKDDVGLEGVTTATTRDLLLLLVPEAGTIDGGVVYQDAHGFLLSRYG